MYEHVDPTPALFGFVEHRGDIVGHGDVSANRRRLTAGRVNGGDDLICLFGARPVVDDDAKPLFAKNPCGRRADSPTGPQ